MGNLDLPVNLTPPHLTPYKKTNMENILVMKEIMCNLNFDHNY